ncbi:basic region/leucine zipper motif 27 [Actinidia rufa]|uniref:Basic region/leucine zipper motif 27 n=1 Tax=Actinidia rufa TaxID=165716 RepID=A0A7J0ENS3_9ERIC|nr:basic region/leucine zipper motif 27 [Actinidia rufa]
MRLCRRSPECPSDSGNLFFPNAGELDPEAKASNDTFKEEMFETGGACKIGSELAMGPSLSGPEFRLSATAGGDAGEPYPAVTSDGCGFWPSGRERKSRKVRPRKVGLRVGSSRVGRSWREARLMSFQTSSMVLGLGAGWGRRV